MGPSHIIREFLLPPGCLILLFLSGLVVWKSRPRLARALVGAATTFLYLLSTSMVAVPLSQWGQQESVFDGSTEAKAIVILGGGVFHQQGEYGGASMMSPSTLQRARYGLRLQRQTGLPVLACGSGSTEPEATEAALIAAYLRDQGVVQVWEERRSSNTWQNARFGAEVLKEHDIDSILLVTNAFHAYRARRCFEAQSVEVESAPTFFRQVTELDRGWNWVLPRSLVLHQSSYAIRARLGEVWYELIYY